MADRAANKRVARALKKGRNPIAGFGAASRRALATRNGPKSSEKDHLQGDQFGRGKHHAPSFDMTATRKNNSGSQSAPSRGKHSLNNGKIGHRGSYSPSKDLMGADMDSMGRGRVGKHRKPGA